MTDQFRDLGDYGVSESFKAVCPVGNPISHSTHVGFSAPDVSDTTCESINCLPIEARRLTAGDDRLPLSLLSLADGVGQRPAADAVTISGRFGENPRLTAFPAANGFTAPLKSDARGVAHNPDPIAPVRGTKGGSWYAMPLRIIPERGQVSENTVKPSTKQCCDVLHDDISGSKFANKTGELSPKAAALSVQSSSRSCRANVLTGEASTYDIDANSVSGQSVGVELADIFIAWNLRPMFRQYSTREIFNLAEGDSLKPARALKAQAEPADTAKEVEDAQLAHDMTPALCATAIAAMTGIREDRERMQRRLVMGLASTDGVQEIIEIALFDIAFDEVIKPLASAFYTRFTLGKDGAGYVVSQVDTRTPVPVYFIPMLRRLVDQVFGSSPHVLRDIVGLAHHQPSCVAAIVMMSMAATPKFNPLTNNARSVNPKWSQPYALKVPKAKLARSENSNMATTPSLSREQPG